MLEVLNVTRYQSETMCRGGSGDKSVHRPERQAHFLAPRHNHAPGVGDLRIDSKDAVLESHRQLFDEPLSQSLAPPPGRHQLDSAADLRERNHADKYPVLISFGQPRNNVAVRLRLHPFGNHVGIEEKAHSSIARGPSFVRLILSPEPRSGEAAKNSARLPARLLLRRHSSAETTTTASLPLRVMICGPSARARSIISLNRDLASSTVHVARPPALPFIVILVMLVILQNAESRSHTIKRVGSVLMRRTRPKASRRSDFLKRRIIAMEQRPFGKLGEISCLTLGG